MAKSSDDPSTATAAYLRGVQNGPNALFWLNRARRLAPNDPRIELEIARQELSAGLPRAKLAHAAFLRLAEQYDIAPAWIGAAVAAQVLGDAAASARALEALLNRHCIPDEKSFSAFAQHIAIAAGYNGYQGYNAAGELVSTGSGRLLGANLNHQAILRIEGMVEYKAGGLSGWAVRPASPDQPPCLTLRDSLGRSFIVKCTTLLPADTSNPLLPRYKFRVPLSRINGLLPPFILSGSGGSQLMGSPIDPNQIQCLPVGASSRGRPPEVIPKSAPLVLVMPVYGGVRETQVAIRSVLKAAPPGIRFVVVNDASPEHVLNKWLTKLAAERKIELFQHAQNLGFCAAANTGFAEAIGCDVLLLNSDILMPAGAIEALNRTAYSDPAIGTVTPFSNEATICSYPDVYSGNVMPDLITTNLFNHLAATANHAARVEIPTGVGFCMYIRHDCLSATGNFRAEVFAQGYGEENDFCIRARHLGYKHVAAMDAYVAHQGGVSFKSSTKALVSRNSKLLNQFYPGYNDLIKEYVKKDPAAPFRTALDEARLRHIQKGKKSVLFISHAHGGGVTKYVDQEISNARDKGLNPLLLTTEFPKDTSKAPYPWPSLLCAGNPKDYPNLTFIMPRDLTALLCLLRQLNVVRVELHHMLGQHKVIRGISEALNVPQRITIHDYASFCPRVNLLNRPEPSAPLRYCGEPDIAGCERCCSQEKEGVFEPLPIKALLARSQRELKSADRITVPSEDVARRLTRHFPSISVNLMPWELDSESVTLKAPRSGKRRIAVIGGIGPQKGFDVLLDCANDIKRRCLPLEFVVIGNSADDALLLEAGIFVSGAYKADEIHNLIIESQADLAFVPSICPETWCFVLSEAWQAGLYTVAFDLGAQAERIRATGRGAILPLGLPPERINNSLMSITF
ncbi:MAG: glycosyltransferase [Rhodospirillales bacterium]|nr:glycosyltransferase [Rhodospirillales bacterium]